MDRKCNVNGNVKWKMSNLFGTHLYAKYRRIEAGKT